jgi:hypothetical protein
MLEVSRPMRAPNARTPPIPFIRRGSERANRRNDQIALRVAPSWEWHTSRRKGLQGLRDERELRFRGQAERSQARLDRELLQSGRVNLAFEIAHLEGPAQSHYAPANAFG